MAVGTGSNAVPCLRFSHTIGEFDVSVTTVSAGVKRECLYCTGTGATGLIYIMTDWLTTVSKNNKATGLVIWTVDAAKVSLFTAATIESATIYPPVMVEECKGPSAAIKRMNKG